MVNRTVTMKQTETEVAVLQVQVQNIEDRLDDVKEDIKSVSNSIEKSTKDTHALLAQMTLNFNNSHETLSKKITSLEKWRWMMVGGGALLGYLGIDMISKMLK